MALAKSKLLQKRRMCIWNWFFFRCLLSKIGIFIFRPSRDNTIENYFLSLYLLPDMRFSFISKSFCWVPMVTKTEARMGYSFDTAAVNSPMVRMRCTDSQCSWRTLNEYARMARIYGITRFLAASSANFLLYVNGIGLYSEMEHCTLNARF